MTRRELTPEERAALSEDKLIQHDLAGVKVRDGMEAGTRAVIRDRIRHERAEAAIRRRATEAGVTLIAMRQAEAEEKAAERQKRAERDLAVARAGVGVSRRRRAGGPPPELGADGVIVLRIIREYRAHGEKPTQEVLAERLGCTSRRIRQVLHEARPPLSYGDVERLAAE